MSLKYFFGRGDVYLGDRDANGEAKALTHLIEVPELEITPSVSRVQNFNTNAAISSKDLDIAHKVDGTVRMVVKDFDKTIIKLGLFGAINDETGTSTFTALSFPSGIAVGDVVPVPGAKSNLSSLTITDSAGTPATLSSGTHYTVDLATGLVTFLNLGSYTQPFKAAGGVAAGNAGIGMLKARSAEKYLIFNGINIASNDEKVRLDLFRVAFFTAQKMGLKTTGEEPQMWEFEGSILADPMRSDSATMGRYGNLKLFV